jgi:arylsulfatase A-like enzyme
MTYFTGKRHSLTRDRIRLGFEQGGVVMGFGGYLTDKRRMPMHDWDPEAEYRKADAYIVSGAPGNPKVPVPDNSRKEEVPAGPFATQLYVDPAVEWIQSYKSDKPWFVYISLSAPHDPHEAPDSIRNMYDPDEIPLPPNFKPVHPFNNGELDVRDEKLLPRPRDPKQIKRKIADYYAAITYVDAQFGRVMEALNSSGQLSNTIVLFAGDSGLAAGQHGLLGKQNLYDEAGIRVPFIMAGVDIPANQRRDALVTTVDVFPTLCDMTGIKKPETLDGESLLRIIDDPDARVHDSVYAAYKKYQRAVIEPRFKLIEYVNTAESDRMTQLFDLKKDPWETTNLAVDPAFKSEVQRLRKKLVTLRGDYGDDSEFWEHFSHQEEQSH